MIREFEPKKKKAKGYSHKLQAVISKDSTIDQFLECEIHSLLTQSTPQSNVDESRLEKLEFDMTECLKGVIQCSTKDINTLLKWHAKMRRQLGIVNEEAKKEEEEH